LIQLAAKNNFINLFVNICRAIVCQKELRQWERGIKGFMYCAEGAVKGPFTIKKENAHPAVTGIHPS